MNKKALYAGTFDPFTYGHLDIVERALDLFDEIIVAIGTNSAKTTLFSIEQRYVMALAALAPFERVVVKKLTGLTAHAAKDWGACCLVRGIRSIADYEYESSVAQINYQLSFGKLDTIFFPTSSEWSNLSSSVVRELIVNRSLDLLEQFLPESVYRALPASL